MENFKIVFCWAQPLPIKLKYKDEVLVKDNHVVIVKANSIKEVIENLKESNHKTISNINNITKC